MLQDSIQRITKIQVILFCLLFNYFLKAEVDYLGDFSFEGRYFLEDGFFFQENFHSSFTFSPEIYFESEDSKQSFTFKPKLRNDSQDEERDLIDIQELHWVITGNAVETRIGIRKEFWGVTETFHRVDIINQTDSVESFDGEDKLGQPMINISLETPSGSIDFIALLGSRERTFAGRFGRLRTPIVVDTDHPIYESGAENKRMDFAIRWVKFFDNLEIGLSHFSGTTREPEFIEDLSVLTPRLIPKYNLIDQTGLEALYILGGLAIKLEAITRSGQKDRFSAITSGFEYTQIGIFESRLDLGWIIEFNHDDRVENSPTALGTRLTFNNMADTQILTGILWNDNTNEKSTFLEASGRIGDCCKLSLEGIVFSKGNKKSNILDIQKYKSPFEYLENEDFVRLEFIYYL